MSLLSSTGEIIGFLVLSVIAIIEALVKTFIPAKYKMKSIAGEIALVTGGGGALGRLLSLRLAKLGAIVVVWDINANGIDETVKVVQAAGGTCYGYVCDLCDRKDVYKNAAIVRQQVGKVTILINNAGVVSAMKFLDTPDELLVRTMNVNIMSSFWTVKAFLPAMLEDNKGHIVTIASMAGMVGIPRLVDYCTSKFAALGFDEALRIELQYEGYNIKTTSVCPYFIRSVGMFEEAKSRQLVSDPRYVSTLCPNDVAERVITAMRCEEERVTLPGYFRGMLALKCLFPWHCARMFLCGLVRDALPKNENTISTVRKDDRVKEPSKDQNGVGLHEQLARRISSSERKP